jgi:hypothetical protein
MNNMVEGTALIGVKYDLPESNLDHSDVVYNYPEVLIAFLLEDQRKQRYFKQVSHPSVPDPFVGFDIRIEYVLPEFLVLFDLNSKLIVIEHNKIISSVLKYFCFLLHPSPQVSSLSSFQ